ncbi:hypothetical protein DAPPUDRAFT_312401 [Daphnia pulex]|uniref:Uncharacterized protein n=1 Tax=Daphnia pulex TaxID=6669 RepID=E9G0Q6_DAPPU|nr:hypothetical protein DAPPUDRAFT_312401 [Daphnia pulex]|eukprot:EFX86946.1 hypothetical protein DAPPUDRAFT_312401 [Daphnia pulex]
MLILGSCSLISEMCCFVQPIKSPINREKEYVVVTGGNRGIGWSTVKALAESGMKVIVGCRDGPSRDLLYQSVKQAELPTESVEWINLDMSSMESVGAFGQAILDKNVPISLLINNAGTMASYTLTKDGFESAFAINYLGHFLLTHLLMPRLIAAGTNDKAARIVNVSSSGQALGFFQINDLQGESYYNKFAAYCQSKAAQIMFTKVLHELLTSKNKPVKVYAVHPGVIKTNVWSKYWFTHFTSIFSGFVGKTEAQGAQRVVYAALSPKAEDLSGNFFENSKVVQPIALVRNRDMQTQLWEKSCQLLDISQFGGL